MPLKILFIADPLAVPLFAKLPSFCWGVIVSHTRTYTHTHTLTDRHACDETTQILFGKDSFNFMVCGCRKMKKSVAKLA